MNKDWSATGGSFLASTGIFGKFLELMETPTITLFASILAYAIITGILGGAAGKLGGELYSSLKIKLGNHLSIDFETKQNSEKDESETTTKP